MCPRTATAERYVDARAIEAEYRALYHKAFDKWLLDKNNYAMTQIKNHLYLCTENAMYNSWFCKIDYQIELQKVN